MKPQEGKTFKELTTFRIGGEIRFYFEAKNIKELVEAVRFAKSQKLQIFVIGGGSDILVSDRDFNGVVIRYLAEKIKVLNANATSQEVAVEGGTNWDELVAWSVKNDLQGIECLSGIPGTVGAAPIQNIGAYGQELREVFVSLTAYDIDGEKFVKFDKNDCKFQYRSSVFKEEKHWQKFIITEVILKLNKGRKPQIVYDSLKSYMLVHGIKEPSLDVVRNAVCDLRSTKFENPKVMGNAGSFFKNPKVGEVKAAELRRNFPDIVLRKQSGKFKGFAGWFIEKAGWKGKSLKGAKVSDMHALILLNRDDKATASEVYELSERIIKDVFKKFGIKLEREVQLINF